MPQQVTIIGGGPSGLMVADILSKEGFKVSIFERKPSFGRKFLMAGRGGLNITHSENIDLFIKKYYEKYKTLEPLIRNFTPDKLQNWCHDLGEETFIGSSGRVFPKNFKASPLLRSWLKRLVKQGVTLHLNHEWLGWSENKIQFKNKHQEIEQHQSNTVVLALGGASWPKLGADGSWVSILENRDIEVLPLHPSNCGFHVSWSNIFKNKSSGQALKNVKLSFQECEVIGEFTITDKGIEGSAIYALSSILRDSIYKNGSAELILDLKPDISEPDMIERLKKPKSRMSTTNYLKKVLNLSNVSIGLLMERPDRKDLGNYSAEKLTKIIKSYSIQLTEPFSLERAISSAGGVSFDAIDENFMLKNMPNVYITGEMLDWEAPTGGYLLQACFSMARHVANSIIEKSK